MGKKQAQCDPTDLEHRLVLAVVPGGRTVENTEAIVEEMARRLDPSKDLLDHDERVAGA